MQSVKSVMVKNQRLGNENFFLIANVMERLIILKNEQCRFLWRYINTFSPSFEWDLGEM